MPITQVAAACAVCGARTRYWFSKNGHRLYRCTTCSLVQVFPIPDSTAAVYSQDYFCGAEHGFGYGDYDADKAADGAFERYVTKITAHRPRRGTLLDVGAATGRFVETARAHGWQAQGVEVSTFAAEQARKRGIDVRSGTLEDQSFPAASFDVITMWDVLEHIASPRALLAESQRLLADGGMLALNLPDAGSIYARVAGRRWQLIIPPEHLMLYNRKNLQALLDQVGFRVVEVRRIGKSFRPSYVAQVLSTIRGSRSMRTLAARLRGSVLDKLSLPVNLRDNMFVLACKK